jgi:hypothetical protein
MTAHGGHQLTAIFLLPNPIVKTLASGQENEDNKA